MKKGTTPSWARPFVTTKVVSNGFNDINLVETLVEVNMAQSKGEAKRLIEQGIIWIDNGVSDLDISFIWDRVQKVKPHEGKFLLVECGDTICIGKTIDDAICHRININSLTSVS